MNRTILVVDDESVTRRLVAFTLNPLNIEVVGAGDAHAAYEIATQQSIDLMLVDINLPEVDGFSFIRILKEAPGLGDVPIIVFTARIDPDDERVARELGVVGFLYKPFSTHQLRDLVSTHVHQP